MSLRPYFETAVLSVPENGGLVIPFELDFSSAVNGGREIFDLMAEIMDVGGISFVQGIFIDNGNNNDALTLTFRNTSNQGFVLRIPGKVQTWQPILVPNGMVRFTALSVVEADRKVQIHLVNFPVMPVMWNVP